MVAFMVLHLLFQIVEIGSPGIFIYGAFMFLMVYSYTTLMDKDVSAMWIEAVKSILGLIIIYVNGSWFGIDAVITGGTILMAAYFIISGMVVGWFVMNELKEDKAIEKRESVIN